MRLVYLCSPYRGDYETNIRLAKQYCKNALESGVVAFAPHLYFAQFYPDTIPEQRKAGLEMGLNMLDKIIAEAAAEIENNNPNPQLIIF